MKMKLSPINQERWRRFKANRRGYISLWIFTSIFVISLFSEFLANEKPLYVSYDHKSYFPVFFQYTDKEFGGDLSTEADYRDPYVKDLISKKGFAVWPPIRYSYQTINYNLPSPAPSPPTLDNWLGTDDKGRDLTALLLYGIRISVLFGILLTVFSSAIGIAAGAVQGYFGGLLDIIGQRFMEIWSGMPTLFLLIILSSFIQPNFWWLLLINLLFGWMGLVGVVRAEFLRGRNLEYVQAAKALGLGNRAIMFKHILPNAMIATITFMPFILIGSISTLTSLDFLGFGLPAGSPSLGDLLSQGKENLQAPWLGISAFVFLAGMFSLLVFIGEGVRDAFDPRRNA